MIKVLEFKLELTDNQKRLVESWLFPMPSVWNLVLSEFEKLHEFTSYAGKEAGRVPCCPLPWNWRSHFLHPTGERAGELSAEAKKQAIKATAFKEESGTIAWWLKEDKRWVTADKLPGKILCLIAPYSNLIAWHSRRSIKEAVPVRNYTTQEAYQKASGDAVYTVSDLNWVQGWKGDRNCTCYSCPVSHFQEPIISTTLWTGKNSPSAIIRSDRLKEYVRQGRLPASVLELPTEYSYGVVKGLCTAWNSYRSSLGKTSGIRRGKPKYKRFDDKLDTLESGRSATARVVGKELVRLPKLGDVKAIGLYRRWVNSDGTQPEVINTFKICRRPSGWYLQLTGDIKRSPRLIKNATKARAADPGVKNYLAFDDGEKVKNPRFYIGIEQKLQKMQRELHHKLTHNLIMWLNAPGRTATDLTNHFKSLSANRATKAIGAKTEKEVVDAIGLRCFGVLREKVGSSNRTKAIAHKISLLHEKTKMQRRHFIHKRTTWDVRKSAVLVFEDGMQSPTLKAKPKPIVNKERTGFDPNGASQQTQIAKRLGDTGYGAYLALAEQKAQVAGRKVIRHPEKGTTTDCPICETSKEMPLWRRIYICDNCGYSGDRDVKAAIVMMVKTYDRGEVLWDQLSGLTKQVLTKRQEYRERVGVADGGAGDRAKPKRGKRSKKQEC